MKNIFYFLLLLTYAPSYAQVKIGSNPTIFTPNTNLEVEATNGSKVVIEQSEGKVGIGTSSLDAKLNVAGDIKIVDGTQGTGKVLTSDANGIASWRTPPACVSVNLVTQTAPITYTTNYTNFIQIPGMSIPLLANKTYKIIYMGLRKFSTGNGPLALYLKYGNDTATETTFLNGNFYFQTIQDYGPMQQFSPHYMGVNKEFPSVEMASDGTSYIQPQLGLYQSFIGYIQTKTDGNLRILGTNSKVNYILNIHTYYGAERPITLFNGYLVAIELAD
ncbi:hypothetical protein CLV98_1323 [Dyadobacter jejuensis]|uniref:Uncharacterized protein n=1 Tax=Dyadobacter jejuensis TaxID=1082580 RepID=A0A316A4X2_9BACT|nr:hypothetical protein [Dyadobacter jejuensis]PWJ52745.1 hypothetical protein CLV98_1323 [Dyadobacter jejuensis]